MSERGVVKRGNMNSAVRADVSAQPGVSQMELAAGCETGTAPPWMLKRKAAVSQKLLCPTINFKLCRRDDSHIH